MEQDSWSENQTTGYIKQCISKYIEYPEFEEYITKHINGEWIGKVNEIKTRLQRGKEIACLLYTSRCV